MQKQKQQRDFDEDLQNRLRSLRSGLSYTPLQLSPPTMQNIDDSNQNYNFNNLPSVPTTIPSLKKRKSYKKSINPIAV